MPAEVRRRNLVDQNNYGEYWDALFRAAVASGEVREDLDLHVARSYARSFWQWLADAAVDCGPVDRGVRALHGGERSSTGSAP